MRAVPWCNAAANASTYRYDYIASKHFCPGHVYRFLFHTIAAQSNTAAKQIQTGASSITHPALSELWRCPAAAPCRSARSLSACSSRPGWTVPRAAVSLHLDGTLVAPRTRVAVRCSPRLPPPPGAHLAPGSPWQQPPEQTPRLTPSPWQLPVRTRTGVWWGGGTEGEEDAERWGKGGGVKTGECQTVQNVKNNIISGRAVKIRALQWVCAV